MSILLVIDMQSGYPAARNKALQCSVRDLIVQHRGPVCIMKYSCTSDVLPIIMDAAERKRTMFVCEKTVDDGSALFVEVVRRKKLNHHRTFILCGVNTPYCVLKTAIGIQRRRPSTKIIIPWKCVRGAYDYDDSDKNESMAALSIWRHEDKKRRVIRW